MARRALSAALGAAGLCAVHSTLLAATLPSQLRLVVSACDGSWIDAREAQRTVRSELEADGVAQIVEREDTRGVEARLSISIGCDTELTTLVTLRSSRTGRERQRSIVLADADNSARARALALAVAEFVRSDWSDLSWAGSSQSTNASAAYPDPQAEPSAPSIAANDVAPGDSHGATPPRSGAALAGPPPVAPTRPVTRAAATNTDSGTDGSDSRGARGLPKLALTANARLRWFVDYASLSVGGDAGPDFGALRVRAELLVSSSRDTLGTASLGSAALCVGYRVFAEQLGSFSIAGYPLASAGATWMRGSPATAGVRSDPTTSLYGDVRFLLESRLDTSPLSPSLAAEVGRASGLVARAGDRTVGATGGFFIGASAGASY